MLIGIYVIALAFGVREHVVSRQAPDVDMLSDEWAAMSDVVQVVNPTAPDTDFLASVQAMRHGDASEFMLRMEAAIESGIKHNDILMQSYAQQLLTQGADYRRVNLALNAWRSNHPTSAETLWLPLAVPPTNVGESAALNRALAEVPWVASSDLRTVASGSGTSTRVHLTFRPPVDVDIRDAIAAVTVLSLSPEERRRYRVRCLTLTDCNVEPR